MVIQEIQVGPKEGPDLLGQRVGNQLKEMGLDLGPIRSTVVYRFEGITEKEARILAGQALTDPVTQRSALNQDLLDDGVSKIEIGYKPGVMNPVEESLKRVSQSLGINPTAVSQSILYTFPERLDPSQLELIGGRLVSQVERVVKDKPETLQIMGISGPVETVPILSLDSSDLTALSDQRRLFLNLTEMQVIQNYFATFRREPTDVEVETLAQTWSEHCGHKTFKAKLVDEEGHEKTPLIRRIRETAQKYFAEVGVVTAFQDNAGGFRFYDGQVVIAKGETHNSPVAVEPYGGSLTKNGGVYRDIAGCGLGGHNILGLMINCFGYPDTPHEQIPQGSLHPRILLDENSRGERDYGNRMGIPTHATSLYFHPDFGPKPTSLGVVVGLIPEEYSQKREPQAGSLIVSVGGRTGRDGIHGATFSSGEMTAKTVTVDATAVQIGNAIEEKRMFDALLSARDTGIIEAITDCGGGGYSSAIGEIGKNVGVEVNLDKVPLKYTGLSPWEIWLSESQERMIVSIPQENLEAFLKICAQFDVPSSVLGHFTGDKILTLKYEGETVGQLSMEFLHEGLPQREMNIRNESFISDNREPLPPIDYFDVYKRVLSHMNICSKEAMLRQYDQTVQGMTVLPPFSGVYEDMPNDASVVTPIYGKPFGVVTSFALSPMYNRLDSYQGTIWAVAAAASKLTAVGGNIHEAALIDNFIWPKPNEKFLSDLDRSVDALCLMMDTLHVPCVSGKDSLSSTFKTEDGKIINIPPVLNITAFGKMPDVEKTVSGDFKTSGSTLVLVGKMDTENLGSSVYFDTQGMVGKQIPEVDIAVLPKTLESVYEAIRSGRVRSCKAIAEGGLATTLAHMSFGGDMGIDIDIGPLGGTRPDFIFFNETAGCLVLEVDNKETAEELFAEVPHVILGQTTSDKKIKVTNNGEELLTAELSDLKFAWKKRMEEVIS